MRRAGFVAVIAALSLLAASPVQAGFRIQEIDPEFPKEVTTTLFQGGKVRLDGALEGLSLLIDLKSGEGWLIEAQGKRYAGGPIADLAAELRKIEEDQARDEAAAEAAAGEAGKEKAGAAESPKPHSIQVKDLGAGEPLLGYQTNRHQVFVDGELLEELWLSAKIDVSREVDLGAYQAALQKMLGGAAAASQGYEESEAYRHLRTLGYPLRQVLHFVGERNTLEVTSVAVVTLPPSDFAVPKGYRKIGYIELLLGESE